MEYNKINSRRWSVIGQRPTFGLALFELAKEDQNIIAIAADVTNSAGLRNMNAELPDQVLNVGIAEQNMMGIATGLASEGYIVFTTSFAPFQAMRCLEQIRVNQGYMGQKVVMVGLASGVAYGELGFTHCTLEDAALMRSIPNIAVVTPADCMEVVKLVEAAIKYKDSVYIRLMDKTNIPMVYVDDYDFQIGKGVPVIEGGDIAILANGPMVSVAIKAAKKYSEGKGVNVSVYDVHTIKPLDTELLDKLNKEAKAIITIEEHYIIGGLGGAVAEYYSDKKNHVPVYKMGFPDAFPHGATHEALLAEYKLSIEGLCEKLDSIIEN